jgi:hypothetical protein
MDPSYQTGEESYTASSIGESLCILPVLAPDCY